MSALNCAAYSSELQIKSLAAQNAPRCVNFYSQTALAR